VVKTKAAVKTAMDVIRRGLGGGRVTDVQAHGSGNADSRMAICLTAELKGGQSLTIIRRLSLCNRLWIWLLIRLTRAALGAGPVVAGQGHPPEAACARRLVGGAAGGVANTTAGVGSGVGSAVGGTTSAAGHLAGDATANVGSSVHAVAGLAVRWWLRLREFWSFAGRRCIRIDFWDAVRLQEEHPSGERNAGCAGVAAVANQ